MFNFAFLGSFWPKSLLPLPFGWVFSFNFQCFNSLISFQHLVKGMIIFWCFWLISFIYSQSLPLPLPQVIFGLTWRSLLLSPEQVDFCKSAVAIALDFWRIQKTKVKSWKVLPPWPLFYRVSASCLSDLFLDTDCREIGWRAHSCLPFLNWIDSPFSTASVHTDFSIFSIGLIA